VRSAKLWINKDAQASGFDRKSVVNFQHSKGWWIHTIAEDCRTTLGPYREVSSEATLLRLFRYLGATPEAIEEAERCLRMWSRGGIHIDVPEDRLYLLGSR
jgi:hypothetical protein